MHTMLIDSTIHVSPHFFFFFFFNDTATTEIYTLSLHDALPISVAFPLLPTVVRERIESTVAGGSGFNVAGAAGDRDRKSTRLNSSHANISYAVFCLKKKKNTNKCSVTFTS